MPTATTTLRRKTNRRTRDRNRRIASFWAAIDAWTRRVERKLLGVVAANRGGTAGVMAAVDDILDDLGADGAAILEKGLRRTWRWSWESATADFVAGIPMTTWIQRLTPIKTMLGTESIVGTDGAALLEFDSSLDAEMEMQRIIDGKVSQTQAREIVRKIEFAPPSEDRVNQILAATNDPDGLSAMDRIKTVAQRDKHALRQTIVSALAEPDRASAMAGLNIRIRKFLDPGKGLNYKARRIARTESVRIAEAGQREAWSEAEDMIEGIQWHSARLPDSREDHVARHDKIYYRTGAGEYVAADGESLPPVPLGPNCVCWTSAVLSRDLTKGLPRRKLGPFTAAKKRADREIAAVKRKLRPKPKRKRVLRRKKEVGLDPLADAKADLKQRKAEFKAAKALPDEEGTFKAKQIAASREEMFQAQFRLDDIKAGRPVTVPSVPAKAKAKAKISTKAQERAKRKEQKKRVDDILKQQAASQKAIKRTAAELSDKTVEYKKLDRVVLQSIETKENALATLPKERGVLFDRNGKVLLEKAGVEDSITFSNADLKKFKGNILTHNHPPYKLGDTLVENVTFSTADVDLMLTHELSEIRAVSKQYRYSLSVKPGAVPKSPGAFGRRVSAEFDGRAHLLAENKIAILREDFRLGKITADEANRLGAAVYEQTSHEAMEMVAQKYNLDYRRILR